MRQTTIQAGSALPFPRDEYEGRWARVYDTLEARGYGTAVFWQRSGGSYDRASDVHWLTGYASLSSGQEPSLGGTPGRAFAALVFHEGAEPVLHIAEPVAMTDLTAIATSAVVDHEDLPAGVARALKEIGVDGEIVHNADDFLPIEFMRTIESEAPGIKWIGADDLLWAAQAVKSSREQERMRAAGEIVTEALTVLMEALIAGEPESEAAARAASVVIRAGGGLQRIGIHHGPKSEMAMWSSGLYGYSTDAPAPGDFVRAWIYGPLLDGYWLDPGRTAVAGNSPRPEQKELIEAAASITDELMSRIRPGVTAEELGRLGDQLLAEAGGDADALWDLYGHGVGKDFYLPPIIPAAGTRVPERAGGTYEAGMGVTVEIFLRRKGVGFAAFERTALVTEDGVEPLDRTPMLFW
jgi:Xaa-Pro aminopeptidase